MKYTLKCKQVMDNILSLSMLVDVHHGQHPPTPWTTSSNVMDNILSLSTPVVHHLCVCPLFFLEACSGVPFSVPCAQLSPGGPRQV
jgi:hypothetical protein